MKLLAPRPEDRYATGRDVAAAIARAMLVKQVLVDGGALETTIAELVPREAIPAPNAGSEAPPEHHTQAAAPKALSGPQGGGSRSPDDELAQ